LIVKQIVAKCFAYSMHFSNPAFGVEIAESQPDAAPSLTPGEHQYTNPLEVSDVPSQQVRVESAGR
jgi:hypothetical protein